MMNNHKQKSKEESFFVCDTFTVYRSRILIFSIFSFVPFFIIYFFEFLCCFDIDFNYTPCSNYPDKGYNFITILEKIVDYINSLEDGRSIAYLQKLESIVPNLYDCRKSNPIYQNKYVGTKHVPNKEIYSVIFHINSKELLDYLQTKGINYKTYVDEDGYPYLIGNIYLCCRDNKRIFTLAKTIMNGDFDELKDFTFVSCKNKKTSILSYLEKDIQMLVDRSSKEELSSVELTWLMNFSFIYKVLQDRGFISYYENM